MLERRHRRLPASSCSVTQFLYQRFGICVLWNFLMIVSVHFNPLQSLIVILDQQHYSLDLGQSRDSLVVGVRFLNEMV